MSYVAAVEHLHGLGLELALPTRGGSSTWRRCEFWRARWAIRRREFPAVLIAGTNGKGSTAATLASICAAAGLRTALYTSPHLSRATERIRTAEPAEAIDEAPGAFALREISEEEFARLYFLVDETAQRLVATGELPHAPSFFESLTALAFLHFAERKAEIAILEVGLGGRLDATNIVEPILAVITDIALDHQEYLGETIAEIAREKAGIMRARGTLVTLPQHAEANRSIGEAAVALDVRVIDAAEFLRGCGFPPDLPEQAATLPLRPNHYEILLAGERLRVRSPLAGEHQRRNLALAIAAAGELRNVKNRSIRNSKSYNITNATIEAGIANTSWPGRLEFLPPDLLLDVAHNPAGAWALRAAIATLADQRPRTLIFSCLRDKDLTQMARILFPLFDSNAGRPLDHIVFAPIDNPRAASLEALLTSARALEIPAQTAANPCEALALARGLTPAGGLIVAAGSIYLAGAVREANLEP